MNFIADNCTFELLTSSIIQECNPFTCGQDADMDEFFKVDAIVYTKYKIGKSYCFRLDKDPKKIVACFTLSNDSIRLWDLGSSKKNKLWKEISNREKKLSRYPGVLIGRLAVAEEFAGKGIGSEILNFIKQWFASDKNKTGCRLVIVDAKNITSVLSFYERNGFKYLFSKEEDERRYTQSKDESSIHPISTRLMYFDLLSL